MGTKRNRMQFQNRFYLNVPEEASSQSLKFCSNYSKSSLISRGNVRTVGSQATNLSNDKLFSRIRMFLARENFLASPLCLTYVKSRQMKESLKITICSGSALLTDIWHPNCIHTSMVLSPYPVNAIKEKSFWPGAVNYSNYSISILLVQHFLSPLLHIVWEK